MKIRVVGSVSEDAEPRGTTTMLIRQSFRFSREWGMHDVTCFRPLVAPRRREPFAMPRRISENAEGRSVAGSGANG